MAPFTTIGAVKPQRRQKRGRLSMSMRHMIHQPLADFRPPIKRCHVRLGPSLINKNEFRYVNDLLEFFPFFSLLDDIVTVLFGGAKRFFSRKFSSVSKSCGGSVTDGPRFCQIKWNTILHKIGDFGKIFGKRGSKMVLITIFWPQTLPAVRGFRWLSRIE